jgi:hypothetical protein
VVNALDRRLRRVEVRRNLMKRIPNVVERYQGETTEAAVGRFCQYHEIAALPEGHPLLIITAFPSMGEFRTALRLQQTQLIANARTVKFNGDA